MKPKYRLGLYVLLASLVVGDSICIGILLGTTRKPFAVAPPQSAPLHPAVLGESTGPLTIRGESVPSKPAYDIPVPTKGINLSSVDAKSFLVYDAASKIILAEKDSTRKMAIASLTKLMTALVVYNTTNFKETVKISERDQVSESPVLGVKPGDEITVEDLFNSMLVGSANDAALSLSHYVEARVGSAFPVLMNNSARQLGMDETNFSNPLGFDSQNNFSSAHDVAILVDATRQYSAFQLLGRSQGYSFKSLLGNAYSVQATNKLIATDPEISAIKTGYTLEAQGAMVTSATHGGHTVIIIVLGSPDREQDTLNLKKGVFDSYAWKSE